jgi:hypothetical protein
MIDLARLDQIDSRLGPGRARQRLATEQRHHREMSRHRLKFLHREHWFWHPHVIKALLWIAGLYARGQRNAEAIMVRRNVVCSTRLPLAFDGFAILHLSDLHADGSEAAMARLTTLIQRLDYDLCVLTGDYRGATFGSSEAALRGIATLSGNIKAPVMAVLGNHDSLETVPVFEHMGIRVLLNETEIVRRSGSRIFIAGIDDAHFFGTHDISKAAAAIPADEFAVLLSHTPEMFREADAAGFDLMLSGHTHGGQICLPGSFPITLSARLPRRFGAGAWRFSRLQGYTSAGVGTSVVPVRFNCPPEITLHELRRVSAP